MEFRKVKNLLKKEESTKLDFKRKIDIYTDSGKKELAKDVCAIANSRGGRGYIIIGVEDKTKEIVGIEDMDLNEESIQQVISSRCVPPIPIAFEFVKYGAKGLGVITIFSGAQKPYQIRDNGAFYIRRGSTTDTMKKEEVISYLSESLSFNIEVSPIVNSSINTLNYSTIDRYFASKGIEISEENRIEFMDAAAITYIDKDSGNRMVTLGGLLIFSDVNSIYLPHNMIKVINRLEGRKSGVTVLQGSLLTLLELSENLLETILPSKYPVNSICEAINNAILYRDYSLHGKVIEIIISENSVIVSSPGAMILNNNDKNHSYIKRNMWIYDKLIALDHKKRYLKPYPGFSIMKKGFKNIGRIKFVNSLEENIFKVIFPGIKNISL
ncbi:AlbA family DNA-binding domain-containing protein [Clostridium tunisiense]|uniref:AlbA family DNA-binding domain-containing protein n=1 Tax=Clostridium tunisiense TaxID=219748 RepID=UPI00030D38AA|nr:ATP-binding protein [Clostridium tunisiense]